MMESKEGAFLKAKKIETGTVIDHVPKGMALKVLRVLGIDDDFPGTVTVLMNVPSSHYGFKDIIKIEGRILQKKEIAKMALMAPAATVNTIQNFTVVDKYVVQVPSVLEGVVVCPNPTCITRLEGTARLLVENASPVRLRCAYCEKVYGDKDITY